MITMGVLAGIIFTIQIHGGGLSVSLMQYGLRYTGEVRNVEDNY